MTTLQINADELRPALRAVMHSAARDGTWPILNSILFDGEDGRLRLVACDNYRISVADVEVGDGDVRAFGRAALRLADMRLVESFIRDAIFVAVTRDEKVVTFAVDRSSVSFPPIDGQYPNYRQITDPIKPSAIVDVNPRYLVDAGKAAKGEYTVSVGITPENIAVPVAIIGRRLTTYVMQVRTAEGEARAKVAEKAAVAP